MRSGNAERKTKETDIKVSVILDGKGNADIKTGIGFFDHMLTALSVHSGISMQIHCNGDLYVDGHHSVEDTGIGLEQLYQKLWEISPESQDMAVHISRWTKLLHSVHLTSVTDRFLFLRVNLQIR